MEAKDRLKASQWLDVAVRQNFSEAQYTLGLMLVEGDGIDKSTNRGLSLLEQAAAQGHKLAINYLKKRNGELTTNEIVGKNFSQIHLWIMRLMKKILQKARKYYTGVGLDKNYEKAYELFLPLAKGGMQKHQDLGGLMKLTGKGTGKDISSARQWLSVAAQKGTRLRFECSEIMPLFLRICNLANDFFLKTGYFQVAVAFLVSGGVTFIILNEP